MSAKLVQYVLAKFSMQFWVEYTLFLNWFGRIKLSEILFYLFVTAVQL